MQELNGYIKLYRKLIRWGWYQDSVVKDLFLHFLLTASYKDFEWMGQELKAGQLIVGRRRLAEELGFSERQIRTALKKLESTGEVTSKSTNKYTIITVVNWEDYQINEETATNDTSNERPTKDQQKTNKRPHLKNNKNIKNIKKRENTRTRVTPSMQSITVFAKENSIELAVANKFFDYYDRLGWKTTRGTDISGCWQDKLFEWNKNEVNKKDKKNEKPFASYDKKLVEQLLNQD